MHGLRILAIVVLLLSYGAVGARQPAVRSAVPLTVSAQAIADLLKLPSADPATLILHVVRQTFDEPDKPGSEDDKRRAALLRALWTPADTSGDMVPLPLDPSIWRETLLPFKVADDRMMAAILGDRRTALLYHGLFALDDATLAWLGPDRETLLHLRGHPGAFATFGRSIHVRAGRIVVPGGTEAEPLWEELVGVSPDKPSAFVQRLFDDEGWLAYLYDTVAHLDPAQQRFALGLQLSESSRHARLRAVLDALASRIHTWRPERTPFSRPPIDVSVMLSTMAVTADGDPAGPMGRRIWEQVFSGDTQLDVPFEDVSAGDVAREQDSLVDAAWLAARIGDVPYTLGRRRLDTVLFAQRVFTDPRPQDAAGTATALRGFAAFPALMLTLERLGTSQASTYVRAAQHAQALGSIGAEAVRRSAIAQFQGVVGIIERAHRSGALSDDAAQGLVAGLSALDVTAERGYDGRLARWVRARLVRALPPVTGPASYPIEAVTLAAMAGVASADAPATIVEWEGHRYRVDPAESELRRLRAVRQRQGGLSLDAALESASGGDGDDRRGRSAHVPPEADRQLAETLASVLYAAHLGEADGQAVTAGNVALRHDFGVANTKTGIRSADAWRLPAEDFGSRSGWRVHGSLLGLEAALGRLALKRIDPSAMPLQPKLGSADRQMAALTVALLNPFAMSDAARDEIAAALGRGRARADRLTGDPADLDAVARVAGLSEWRRQALAWMFARDRKDARAQLSLVELFWLGSPRPSAIRSLDAWGAAVLPLTGCLCLRMPDARPWEDVSGRPTTGLLGTRTADVALLVADTLASLRLPASLAPAVLGFAMLDVTEQAQPGYEEDWTEFGRAAMDLPITRVTDYVSALTAGGPLVPADARAQHP